MHRLLQGDDDASFGEQMEQIWAELKALARSARYMAPAHWWDAFNSAILQMALLRQAALPTVLSKQLETIPARIGGL